METIYHVYGVIPFKRLQFPIHLAFAMTINKAQCQTMTICGLDLGNPVLFLRPIIRCVLESEKHEK